MAETCVFCAEAGGELLWEDDRCRVVWAYEPDYPALCRVIWDRHVREMADLQPADRDHIMRVVFAAERALITLLAPDKMNLASLGNQVPHIHWHLVPRFRDDPHFPNPIWGQKLRPSGRPLEPEFSARMRRTLDELLKGRGLASRN
jgi:diadenosine tetraphosphate (Ap4A) HIT family hydrolase